MALGEEKSLLSMFSNNFRISLCADDQKTHATNFIASALGRAVRSLTSTLRRSLAKLISPT